MDDNKKSYYAIIPANIRYDEDLTPNAKLLYGEITALCNEKGFCWATNDYFAKLYNVSKTSISKWIAQLNSKKYIEISLEYKEGSKQILNRYLRILKGGIEEKLNTPIEEKLKDNNTLINNTININIVDSLFLHWVNCNLIAHKKETVLSEIKKKHKDLIKIHGEEIIKKAISNYSIIIKDDKYWFTYQWAFWDFISRGLNKFMDEAKPFDNYLKEEYKKTKLKSYEDEYLKQNSNLIDNL